MVKLLERRGMAWLPSRSLEEKTLFWFPDRHAIYQATRLPFFEKSATFLRKWVFRQFLQKDA